jgi:hypothetical protein
VYEESWATDERLLDKRLRVYIQNTRPNEPPFVAYQGQSVQGNRAMVTGQVCGDKLEVDVVKGSRVFLAPHFLIPQHPNKDNQLVVVLEGERKGELFKTMKIAENPGRFNLSKASIRKRRAVLEMDATQLAVSDFVLPKA